MEKKTKCPACGNESGIEVLRVRFVLEERHQCGTLAAEQVSRGQVATCRCPACGAQFQVKRAS